LCATRIVKNRHSHVFLGERHAANEVRTWAAISITSRWWRNFWWLLFRSLAVVAGFHMATHALALFIAALAYTYARRHANDFGTGKLRDLAGYTSAIAR
jgi:Co/Zn/Cd efflux system component